MFKAHIRGKCIKVHNNIVNDSLPRQECVARNKLRFKTRAFCKTFGSLVLGIRLEDYHCIAAVCFIFWLAILEEVSKGKVQTAPPCHLERDEGELRLSQIMWLSVLDILTL